MLPCELKNLVCKDLGGGGGGLVGRAIAHSYMKMKLRL